METKRNSAEFDWNKKIFVFCFLIWMSSKSEMAAITVAGW